MGFSSRRWQSLMVDFRNFEPASMQLHGMQSENQIMSEPRSEQADSPDEVFARSETRAKLNSLRETLPARYQHVVTLYYERDLTMKEIGGILGINESRVSQIHKCALQRMRTALAVAILDPGLRP
jgi:RNA polymerase sigma factor for flagellar operon FliA